MSEPEPRRDGPYELPVERLAAGRGQRRRAVVAILSLGLAVGGAIGLARLTGDRSGTGPAVGPSGGDTLVRASPATGPSAGSSPGPRRSIEPRIEHLVDATDVGLPGAPHVLLVERVGRDIRLGQWTAGAGIAPFRTFRAALSSETTDVIPVLAPTDDRLVLFELGQPGDARNDRARLVEASGRVLWTGEDLAAISGAAWSPDGRIVVMAGTGRLWHLVRIDETGTATDRTVTLPFRVFLPTPLPKSWLTFPGTDPRTVPLGFSADGRWVYGGIAAPELGLMIAEFRVAVDGSAVEPVPDLGVGQPAGLAPQAGALGGRLVDPTTGRVASLRVNANSSGGPPTIEVHNPDAGFVFSISDGTPIGSGWGADGGLYVLSADAPLYADQVRLIRYGPDGSAGPPILTMGPLTSADFLGVLRGYGALAGTTTRPTRATQLILVDLADPSRIAAVPLPDDTTGSIIGVELRP
jgi:hypothetical protein